MRTLLAALALPLALPAAARADLFTYTFTGTHFVDPYDFIAHNHYPLDREGHGTFVTGTKWMWPTCETLHCAKASRSGRTAS